jgi:copper transport protein
VRRTAGLCLAAWLAALTLMPALASAHAALEETSPGRGAALDHAPSQVVFRFDEPVEVAFGAVRVYDQQGERVDEGSAEHPGGRSEAVAVALRDGLTHGTYTATYRVVSADSHPVAGGFVFSVGRAGTPSATVDELIDSTGTGPVTEVAFGIVRALAYLALALTVGGAVFLAVVWRPLATAVGRPDSHWTNATAGLVDRAHALMLAGALLGIATSAAGIAFQGAVAAGTSLWQALDVTVIGDVLDTRFGTVWALRLLAWIAVTGLLLSPRPRRSLIASDPRRWPERSAAVALTALLAFLCTTPALAGHASTVDGSWLAVPANVLHVVCMSVWVGGILALQFALPAATRQLDGPQRTSLIARTLSRFSTLALAAVAGLIVGGVAQTIVELDALSELTDTAFGRAILVKVALLAGLIALGAWNRQRARPRLAALADRDQPPGSTGLALRRSLRTEGTLMVIVLGATAALVSYSPATGASGPFSTSEPIGPARLELTVDPARAGRNEVHLYLFDRASGRQYDRIKQLTVTARLPDKSIGPLPLDARKAGPGHYVIRAADIAPPGDWRLDIAARVSAFDAYTARLEVPIR